MRPSVTVFQCTDSNLRTAACSIILIEGLARSDYARSRGARARAKERLQACFPTLTARELDVCEGILRGWTYDGIAVDLGLTPASVKTYRNRAFDRLGIHYRSQLFALLMPGGS